MRAPTRITIRAHRLFWLLIPFLSLTSGALAASKSDTFVLPNGLKVIAREDSSSHLVAVQMWVGTGSADEAPEEAGMAHLMEHLLFRGVPEEGGGKVAAEAESLGGRVNGYTTRDRTVYHMVLPAVHVLSGLKLLARLMQLPSLDEAELTNEIQVVLEEWKRDQDNPRSRALRELFRTAYLLHPYGRPVLGTPETLRRITLDAVRRFYERRYGANNMTLILVGNFSREAIRKDIHELFATLPSRASDARAYTEEPAQVQPRATLMRALAKQAHLMVGFHIPDPSAGDTPALDLLAFILGRGESSRLAQRVKISEGLVHSISASTLKHKDRGLFLIEAQAETSKTMDSLQAVLREVYRLRDEGVRAAELTRAYVNFARTFIERKESVEGQARLLGGFDSWYGQADYEEAYLDKIRQLGTEQLKSIAASFFRPENLLISVVVPEEAKHPDDAEIAKLLGAPPPSPSVRREPRTLRTRLPNGLRIWIEENPRVPLFVAHAGVIGGLLFEDETNNGIHNLIATMLTQGTLRLSTTQLLHEVEGLGGMLNAAAGNSMLSLTGVFPSERTERGLEIFLDTLLYPAFPQEQLEKKRQQVLTRIVTRQEHVRNQAFRLFYETLFRSHPYRLDPLGQAENILHLKREELIDHYQRLIAPERLVLSIVGDVDGEKILEALQTKLSSIPNESSPFALPAVEMRIRERRIERRSSKTKQAHLVIGFRAPAQGHSDYFTMKVLETVLSRIGGRLFIELRDKQGLAYSVGAFSLDDPVQGAFGIYAATDPAAVEKMMEGIFREIRRLHEEELSTDELNRAKKYLIGNYLIARQTNASKAADMTFNELFGFGADFGQRYQNQIEKVSAADVLKFARDYLDLDHYALTIMGP